MALPLVTVEGRVALEPELRFSPQGVAVAKLRLVASSRKKNEQDEWVDDKTLWLSVTCFKQMAEHVAESIAKSDIVIAVGRLQTDEWTTEAGEKRSQIVMLADSISPSLQFRTIPHGSGYKERSSSSSSSSSASESPALPQNDEPPF